MLYKWLVIGISGISLICCLYFYNHSIKLERELSKSKDTILVKTQNQKAIYDILTQKNDTIQKIALYVKDLQKENNVKDSKYTLLKQEYSIMLDSLKIYRNKGKSSNIGDSIYIVNFEGKTNHIRYDGYTEYYVKNGLSYYTLNVIQDSILFSNRIFLGLDDNLYSEFYSNGIILKGVRVDIDNAIFLRLKKQPIVEPYKPTFLDKLSLYGDINYQDNKFNLGVGFNYRFEMGIEPYIVKYLDNNGLKIGIIYDKPLSRIF